MLPFLIFKIPPACQKWYCAKGSNLIFQHTNSVYEGKYFTVLDCLTLYLPSEMTQSELLFCQNMLSDLHVLDYTKEQLVDLKVYLMGNGFMEITSPSGESILGNC